MKCTAVARTSQNGQFFIKSTFLPQWIEHPHGIYFLVNLVHSLLCELNEMCGSGQNVNKRTVFHQIHVSATMSSLI